MKKLLYSLAIAGMMFSSCSKDEEGDTGGGGGGGTGGGISPVPTSFTQKAFIEEFTGAWCGYCPDGVYKMNNLISSNPGKVVGASIHEGDPMEISLFNSLDATYNVSGFPQGMVSRVPYSGNVSMSRSNWTAAVNAILAKTAKCGLALNSALVGTDSLKVTVHCGFNEALTGDYRLTVYLLEDSVTGGSSYNQANYYNSDAASPFYQLGNPIIGYKHNHTVRKVLTANLGDAIPASSMVAGGEYKVDLGVKLTGFDSDNCRLVALIHRWGTAPTTHEVMNVQEVEAGDVQDWD